MQGGKERGVGRGDIRGAEVREGYVRQGKGRRREVIG